MAEENTQPSQSKINEHLLTKLFVIERITIALLSLWVSAVPSDEEAAARIDAIRTTTQTGINYLSDAAREQATRILTETLDRVEAQIKQRRAAISAAPKGVQ
jgi:hypothetical protein